MAQGADYFGGPINRGRELSPEEVALRTEMFPKPKGKKAEPEAKSKPALRVVKLKD